MHFITSKRLSCLFSRYFTPKKALLFYEVTGTDDGWVHRCSVSYSEQYLDSFQAHLGSVYSVSWSPFRDDLFLSCGSDWTVCLWLIDRTLPILTFNTNQDEISDLKWCPFHSTVFACVTTGGKIEVLFFTSKYRTLILDKT